MRHGVSYSEPHGAHLEAEARRESGEEITLIDSHVGSRLVVVCESCVEVFRRSELYAEHQVAEEIAYKLILHLLLLHPHFILMLIIRELPFGKVLCRNTELERRLSKPLCNAELNIERKPVVMILETLYLTTEVLQHCGKGEIIFRVIVIHTKISRQCHRLVAVVVRIYAPLPVTV